MGSTLCCHLVHIVFSTKNREPFILVSIALRLHAYLGGIARSRKCEPVAVGGVEDHVHLLIGVHPSIALADLVRDLKANSSKWMHDDVGVRNFAWQSGYGAFSVSRDHAEGVTAYIRNQREHHATVDFKGEFLAFLDKHIVEFDERYVFA
ncbi:MAG: IS200/IS605 family transposase [Planctomycetes bacterium]|nr:IS200/IS605 family transposase [Planctomycetota bacterium]